MSVSFTADTYSGNTLIGSTKATALYEIPDLPPTITQLGLSDKTGLSSRFGNYVQGQSVLVADVAATGQYGATIKSYTIQAGSAKSEGSTAEVRLRDAGQVTVTVAATDSRGSKATTTRSITVIAYHPPIIQITDLYRCDSAGNNLPDGSYAKVIMSSQIAALDGKNSGTVTLKYRTTGSTSWKNAAIENQQAIIAASTQSSYEYQAICQDAITTQKSKIQQISVGITAVQIDMDGNSVSIGEVVLGRDTFAVALTAIFKKALQIMKPPQNPKDAVNLEFFRTALQEDPNHPGCYYRMVNGSREWLNPPMELNTEYRTVERMGGRPVFAKLIDVGALKTNGAIRYDLKSLGASTIIYASGYYSRVNSPGRFIPYIGSGRSTPEDRQKYTVYMTADINAIGIDSGSDMPVENAHVYIKYLKA